jgi:hypothetical protein
MRIAYVESRKDFVVLKICSENLARTANTDPVERWSSSS